MMRTRLLLIGLVMTLGPLLFASCGGGGKDDGGGGGVVSGHVPYLKSSPTITYAHNGLNANSYDVTVALEADGPTGVMYVSLWIFDAQNSSNFTALDLTQFTGTKRWAATTNYLVPLPPGQYYIDNIVLNDGDPFSADPLRTGWYFSQPMLSSSAYYVDEREMSNFNMIFSNVGVSGIPITRFNLP